MNRSIVFVLVAAMMAHTVCAALEPVDLKVAEAANAIGIDGPPPILRWSIKASRKDVHQKAYQVRIATNPDRLAKADVWDSGRMESNRSRIAIPESVKLLGGERYCWQVRIWDRRGEESDWSKPSHFSTALGKEDWSAVWMGPPAAGGSQGKKRGKQRPTWWMRRTLKLDAVPDRVALGVVCLGYYELYVNGKRVGDEPLAPAVTKLDKRGLCVTHEIGDLLQPGENIIALACSSGWYLPNQYKVHQRVTPLIRLQAYTRSEGTLQTLFGSDADWLGREANRSITGGWDWAQFGGEAVDGRVDDSQWKTFECPLEGWRKVCVVPAPPITVQARTCPPNHIGATYKAEKVRELNGGVYEVDFGRCLAGMASFRFPNVPRDREITMRFFDLPAGKKKKGKDHSYKQISTYIARGDGTDCFENTFNYAGFRYATIEGLDAPPALSDMKAMLVETAIEPTGTFRCSNDLFNRIHELNVHTIRCLNLGGYHVDCPHRERKGYGADGQTALPAYPYLFDSEAFLHKWLVDWLDVADLKTGRIPHTAPVFHRYESPAWGGIVGPLAWKLYVYYGDRRALEIAHPVIKANLQRLQSWVKDGVLSSKLAGQKKFHGDWVAPGRGMNSRNKPTWEMKELFNTAYLIYLWQTYADISRVLEKDLEVERAEGIIASLRKTFHGNFYDETSGYYLIPEQAYQAMPLWVGAVPAAKRDEMHAKLIDLIENKCKGHLDTGLPATTFLLDYLEQSGNHETIYTIMNKETYPSWGYMLAKGATTIWEQWDGYWSQIHSCFAGPASWFYTGLAGIRPSPEHPGFEAFVLAPAFVEEIDFVEATYKSIRGPIGSAWRRNGKAIQWTVTIPANTRAMVHIPSGDPKSIRLDGKQLTLPVTSLRDPRGKVHQRFELPSGTWNLEW